MARAGSLPPLVVESRNEKQSSKGMPQEKNNDEMVTFISGWMVYPNGKVRLVTPYGGA